MAWFLIGVLVGLFAAAWLLWMLRARLATSERRRAALSAVLDALAAERRRAGWGAAQAQGRRGPGSTATAGLPDRHAHVWLSHTHPRIH